MVLMVRFRPRRVGECDALRDGAACARNLRGRHQVARSLDAQPRIRLRGDRGPRGIGRQVGELVDHVGARLQHDPGQCGRVEHVDHDGPAARRLDFVPPSRPSASCRSPRDPSVRGAASRPPSDDAGCSGKEDPHGVILRGRSLPRHALAMPKPPRLRKSFFDRSVHEVAPELIGATLPVRVERRRGDRRGRGLSPHRSGGALLRRRPSATP